ncbi:MAG: HAMP domain-containing histidine kinase [Bdellovibrionaceae bacterium]|nr:HAMP domain-containing histidine kinase [Pseudobdellovibrionaceae bacterium]
MKLRTRDARLFLAILWLGFTTALAVWILIFNLSFFDRVESGSALGVDELARHHRMIFWEMLTLILSLLIGGAALFALILQERARAFQIQKFFATFSHELKTSLSRLKLQTENILSDFKSSDLGRPAVQLLEDLGRLEVQLENSLFLARGAGQSIFVQELSLASVISTLQPQFPLQITLKSDAKLRADIRILESVLKNLMQNAVVHGDAGAFRITPGANGPDHVKLEISDDGKGFAGDRTKLGQLFTPQGPTGGSGLGLSLAAQLLHQIDGEIRFVDDGPGFQVEVILPGEVVLPKAKAGGAR